MHILSIIPNKTPILNFGLNLKQVISIIEKTLRTNPKKNPLKKLIFGSELLFLKYLLALIPYKLLLLL